MYCFLYIFSNKVDFGMPVRTTISTRPREIAPSYRPRTTVPTTTTARPTTRQTTEAYQVPQIEGLQITHVTSTSARAEWDAQPNPAIYK